MSQNSKKSALGTVAALLAGLVIAKGLWSFVEFKYLPKQGVEATQEFSLKPLYYHYNLASKKEVLKPIVHKQPPKKITAPKILQKKVEPEKIDSFIFKGLYNSKEKKLIVVEYIGKTAVLGIGDELEHYKLKELRTTVATFVKNGKEYTLDLYKPREKKPAPLAAPKAAQPAPVKVAPKPQSKAAALAPTKDGETTVIPKDLFDRYRSNVRQIQKSINAVPNMVNGQIEGFKVNFIKKGSDFAKLGIQRGDIITAINGEPLTNLKVPIEFFNSLDTITAATFTIRRGNELKELEYEVR